ncbi:hypothetical protein B488_09620 [Liberibacter crescens BT-1]|uniref:Uncharacterized protein n=1 Tax=Liberibacter crescens (strain BT-1) TaxID=1215343 RepID=L0ETT6_LIBCB|nr:SPOR domain-containing protein [Liberibacter crescens]AGA64954.1 hypothetical protein B488_09620 [Liberibacter crescens BT-1]AMC12975.1 hypothetical protein RL73_04845 [Liberibacter crescens]
MEGKKFVFDKKNKSILEKRPTYSNRLNRKSNFQNPFNKRDDHPSNNKDLVYNLEQELLKTFDSYKPSQGTKPFINDKKPVNKGEGGFLNKPLPSQRPLSAFDALISSRARKAGKKEQKVNSANSHYNNINSETAQNKETDLSSPALRLPLANFRSQNERPGEPRSIESNIHQKQNNPSDRNHRVNFSNSLKESKSADYLPDSGKGVPFSSEMPHRHSTKNGSFSKDMHDKPFVKSSRFSEDYESYPQSDPIREAISEYNLKNKMLPLDTAVKSDSFEIDLDGIERELSALGNIQELDPLQRQEVSSSLHDDLHVQDHDLGQNSHFKNSDFLREDNLGFDPVQIVDSEEYLEMLDDLSVPSMPIETDQPFSRTSEYGLDLDTEMASFISENKKASSSRSHHETASKAFLGNINNDFKNTLDRDFQNFFPDSAQNFAALEDSFVHPSSMQASREITSKSRKLWIGAGGVLIIVIGYGAYSLLDLGYFSGAQNGEPRVIAAAKDLIKVIPAIPGGKAVPNQDKAVYDHVSGNEVSTPNQKKLVNSQEEPIDFSKNAPRNDGFVSNKDDSAVIPEFSTSKVRTVSIKPKEAMPEGKQDSNSSPPPSENIQESQKDLDISSEDFKKGDENEIPVPSLRPIEDSVVLMSKKENSVNSKHSVFQDFQTKVPPVQKSVVSKNGNEFSKYGMQIASLPTEAEARRSWEDSLKRYNSILSGLKVEFRETVIAGKGKFYRVHVLTETKEQASGLCQRYRSLGGSCLVSR